MPYSNMNRDQLISLVEKLSLKLNHFENREYATRCQEKSSLGFCLLVENTEDHIARYNSDACYVYANPAVLNFFKLNWHDVVGKKHYELEIEPDIAQEIQLQIRKVFRTGKSSRDLIHWKSSSGEIFLDCKLVPEFSPKGEVISVLEVSRNVTDMKIAEDNLWRKNIALEEILESIQKKQHATQNMVKANVVRVIVPLLEKVKTKYELAECDWQEINGALEGICSSLGFNLSRLGPDLSGQEMRVCRLIREGGQEKEIAHILSVSIETVKTYKKRIRKKLNIPASERSLKAFLLRQAS